MIGGGKDRSGIASKLNDSGFKEKLGGCNDGNSDSLNALASFNGDNMFLECFLFCNSFIKTLSTLT